MQSLLGMDYFGKRNIVSHYDHCDACRKLTALSSYTTMRFIHLRGFPLIPFGNKNYILDECPYCEHRTIVSNKKQKRQRKKDLAIMMDGFTSEPDNPDTARNGLQTLMMYNEESWFMDCTNSYGRRFETHMQVQLKIAEGLCRFGHYAKAATYCNKAIELGARAPGEELLALCQSQIEKKKEGSPEPSALQPESMLRPFIFLIIIILGLLISLTAYGISATRNHSIWLVSGASKAYSIELDGTLYRLNPHGIKQIKVRLGEHQMQIRGIPGRNTIRSFSYKTSLLRQKLENHLLVINPDAMAFLVEETLFAGQKTNHYRFGTIIYELEGIDYPFTSFPPWIGSKKTKQTRLFCFAPKTHFELIEDLRLHGSPGDVAKYARRALMIDPAAPESKQLLQIALDSFSETQSIQFLQRGISIHPPLLIWHLFYQDFIKSLEEPYDLPSEYSKLRTTYPDEPLYAYLLGCVSKKRSTAILHFQESEKGSGVKGMGYYAITRELLYTGQFKTALTYSKKALEQSPNNLKIKKIEQQIHLALNQYDPPLQYVQARLLKEPENGEWVAKQIRYLTLLGKHKAVEEIINCFPDETGKWEAYFKANRFYVVGNTSGYIKNLQRFDPKNAHRQYLLYTGKIEEACTLPNPNLTAEYMQHLLLYCAAQYHSHSKIAKTELVKAIASIGKKNPVQREITAILSAPAAPSTKQLLELRIMPKEKAILCTALGFKFPAHKKTYFKLARKFNSVPEPPWLLLRKWTRLPASIP